MHLKILICLILLTIALSLMLINKKIRCFRIFGDFFRIFYDNRTNKISWFDIITFFFCPIVISVSIVVGFEYSFSVEVSKALLTIFSILFTLLFGVMSLLTATLNSNDKTKRTISSEAFTAVSFTMITSLVSLIIIVIYIVLMEKIENGSLCFQIITGAIIAIAINMIMLFFMIIKRSYVTSLQKDE